MRRLAPLLAVLLALPAAFAKPPQAVETFDAVWQLVDESPYDVRARGIDWDAIGQRHRAKALAADSPEALRRVIAAMLEEIGESHFGLVPASVGELANDAPAANAAGTGFVQTGLVLGLVEGRMAVLQVRPGSPAERLGIAPGWQLLAVDGHNIAQAMQEIDKLSSPAQQRRARLLLEGGLASRLETGRARRPLALRFADTSGKVRALTLTPAAAHGTPVNIPLLPPLLFTIEQQRLPLANGGCIGYVRFNFWAPTLASAFPEALAAVRECRGLVIDLRGNPGGVIGTAMGVGGYLVDTPTPLGYFNAGTASARLPALPRRVSDSGEAIEPYAGPIAILIDSRSASTSEVFTSGMQAAGRAHVIGTASAGMALPSVMKVLPNGDHLLYAIADLTAPDGRRLEGHGIRPDIDAPPRLQDLAEGKDNALAAARQWLQTTLPAATLEPR